jgi:hypothetical protein
MAGIPPRVLRCVPGSLSCFVQWTSLRSLVDTGYQGLARDHPDQVNTPPLKPDPKAPLARHLEWQTERKAQSSQRIPVEHAIAEAQWLRCLERNL